MVGANIQHLGSVELLFGGDCFASTTPQHHQHHRRPVGGGFRVGVNTKYKFLNFKFAQSDGVKKLGSPAKNGRARARAERWRLLIMGTERNVHWYISIRWGSR